GKNLHYQKIGSFSNKFNVINKEGSALRREGVVSGELKKKLKEAEPYLTNKGGGTFEIKKVILVEGNDQQTKGGQQKEVKPHLISESGAFGSVSDNTRINITLLHQINTNGSIDLPFGRAVETYILSLPIVKGSHFKCQSRQKVNQAIQKNFIMLKREEGAIDFKGWTSNGMTKSTNRLDDVLELTEKEKQYIIQIQQGLAPDFCIWYWVFYCAGDGNCQRDCGGFGSCLSNFSNYRMNNNLKNGNDMHKCKVCIITKVMLSMVAEQFPIQFYIQGQHIPTNVSIQHKSAIMRLNLTPFNGISKEQLEQHNKYRTDICNERKLQQLLERNDSYIRDDTGPWTILHRLIIEELKKSGSVLYYQQEDQTVASNSSQHYYQLTVSNNIWLEQARDYGSFCF
ncbi:3087_t:CDS:2, partial [Gigaspora rosea]